MYRFVRQEVSGHTVDGYCMAPRLPSLAARRAAAYACRPSMPTMLTTHSHLRLRRGHRVRPAACDQRTFALRLRRRATVAGFRELRASACDASTHCAISRRWSDGSKPRRCSTPNAPAEFVVARSSSPPARRPRSSTRVACAARLRSLAERGPMSERVRTRRTRRDQSRARPQRRNAPRRSSRRRHIHSFVRSRRRRVRRSRHPRRRIRGRRTDPRRAAARAPLRRSALPARVLRQHEERTPPVVRHGDVRQSREGRAASGEAEGALSPVVEVVRTYLELRSRRRNSARAPLTDPQHRASFAAIAIAVDHYRRLYRAVGERGTGTTAMRGPTSDSPRISRRRASPSGNVSSADETRRLLRAAASATTARSRSRTSGSSSEFIGRGLGKAMLTRAAEEAWALAPTRVWLHTCTLDSPQALPNYRARGFEQTVKTETYRHADRVTRRPSVLSAHHRPRRRRRPPGRDPGGRNRPRDRPCVAPSVPSSPSLRCSFSASPVSRRDARAFARAARALRSSCVARDRRSPSR